MPNSSTKPVDSIDGPDKQYADFIEAGRFMIQHCLACEKHVFYPRIICSHCGSPNLEWVEASGRGTVYSTSTPRGGKGGDYNISLIDLEEGPRMMSRVVDVDPDDVKIGMPVQAFIGDIDDIANEDTAVVLFKPAVGGGK